MAKLTEAQAKKLAELRALEEAPDDEPPEEVAFEIGGARVWIPYKQAKTFLKKNGIDLDEMIEEGEVETDGESEEEEEGEEGDEPEGELEETEEVPRIPRKKPAKKVAEAPIDERSRSQRYFRKSS